MGKDTPEQFAKRLRRIGRNLDAELERVALLGAQVIVRGSKLKITQKGHIVTGALRRDIQGQTKYVTPEEVAIAIGVSLHYGKYVEALPDGGYLFEAVEENAAEAIRVIGRELERVIAREAA